MAVTALVADKGVLLLTAVWAPLLIINNIYSYEKVFKKKVKNPSRSTCIMSDPYGIIDLSKKERDPQ
jgi:hypothetical protein